MAIDIGGQRVSSKSAVLASCVIVKESSKSGGRVEVARCVAKERLHAGRRVVSTIDVVIKCVNTVGRVEIAGGIAD